MSEAADVTEPPNEEPETREVLVLSLGARLGLVLAGLIAVAAAVAFWMPVERLVPPAPPVPCGSAADPVTAQPAASLCGELAPRQRVIAVGLGAAALIVGAGTLLAYGADRRTQVAVADQRGANFNS